MIEKIGSVTQTFKGKQIDAFKKQLKVIDDKNSGIRSKISAIFSPKKKLFKKVIKRVVKKAKKVSKKNHKPIHEIIGILDKHREQFQSKYQTHPDEELEEAIQRINSLMLTVLPHSQIPAFEPYTFQRALMELNDFFLSLSELNQTNFALKKTQTFCLLKKAKTAARRKTIVKKFTKYVKKIIG